MFPFPKAVSSSDTKPQEVVQFEIWYRKLSKSGDENELKTFKNIAKQTSSNQSKKDLTSVDRLNLGNVVNVNATFSNWKKYKTDARRQVKNEDTGQYEWEIEDVSDANTPTINEVDIPVEVGETIEIKIRSLSEIGYPEAPLKSDFSNTLTIPFPSDLESIINEDDFILNDAQSDNLKIEVMKELENRGLDLHLESQIRDVDIYYAHKAEAIASGFKDDNGKIINLYDYLVSMKNEMTALKEEINRSKGILEIYLIDGNSKKRIYNKDNVKVNTNVESYLRETEVGVVGHEIDLGKRVYRNEVIRISNYAIEIKNAAQEALLGILSDKGYGSPTGFSPSTFAYGEGFNSGDNNYETLVQPFYVDKDGNPLFGDVALVGDEKVPKIGTQLNNSWLWQKILDIDGKPFCAVGDNVTGGDETKNFIDGDELFYVSLDDNNGELDGDIVNNKNTLLYNGVEFMKDKNFGFYGHSDMIANLPPSSAPTSYEKINNIADDRRFTFGTLSNETDNRSEFMSTVHARINTLNDIIDKSSDKVHYIGAGDDNAITIPLYIYAKPNAFSRDFVDDNGPNGEVDITTGITAIINCTYNDDIEIISEDLATILNSSGTHYKKHKIMLKDIDESIDYKLYNIKDITTSTSGSNPDTITLNKQYMGSPTTGDEENLAQIHICHLDEANNGQTNPIETYNVYSRDVESITDSYVLIKSGSSPQIQTKGIGFYMETENSLRPIEFDIKFKISQHQVQFNPLSGIITDFQPITF